MATGPLDLYLKEILVDGAKQGVATDSNSIADIAKKANGTFQHLKLNEKIMSDHWSFLFEEPNSFMFDAFNRKVFQLVESGIAERNVKEFTSFRKNVTIDEPLC